MEYILSNRICGDPNAKVNLNESTPVQIATKNGHIGVVKLLLQYCPSLQQEIPFQHSRKTKDNLLYLAVKAKHMELV